MSSFDAPEFLKNLTEEPGVYRMIGADDLVLYVGKAKNLKRRVSSYFQKTLSSPRIAMMAAQIIRVDVTPVRSEAEALLLENNLIKSLAPKYNILFRDDKSYPFIAVSGDEFPRLAYHRGAFAEGTRYFGPFPNAWAARESIHLLQKIFQLRTCENAVFRNRSRACLLHQIKRCTAPCVAQISHADYQADVRKASLFLDGKTNELIDSISSQMQRASESLEFELAAQFRDQITTLQSVLHKQFVDTRKDVDIDIIYAHESEGVVCVNIAMVRGGRHLGDRPQFPSHLGQGGAADALLAFVEQHYSNHPVPQKIIVAQIIAGLAEIVAETVDKPPALAAARFEGEKAWLDQVRKNAELAIAARLRDSGRIALRQQRLCEALLLEEPPQRIECFDISHTMGEATVASCVVAEDGVMKRSEYRRYNISGITPGDDYAAMRQALSRRYEKLAGGEGVRPELILIDGGKGQLAMAVDVMNEIGLDAILLVGVAKGEGRKAGLEILFFADGRAPLNLDPGNPGLHLIQEIRDEAHRFAITGHRAKRGKARVGSRLEDIEGIGVMRRRALLAAFGGLDGVRQATIEDLCRVDGISRKIATNLYNALRER